MKGKGHFRATCPACSSNRRLNRNAQCLSLTVDAEKVVYMCHHCERKGAVRLEEGIKPTFTKGAVKAVSMAPDAAAIAYLKSRGIRSDTIELFGVASGRAFFPDLRHEAEAVAFPYHARGGKVLGHKLRAIEAKAHVCSAPVHVFFGRQLLDMDESTDLHIAEGEIDCLSLHEAGLLNPVSVPNGGQSLGTGENGVLWDLKEEIDKAKRVVIAVDADEVGTKLAEELARRIGRHKCWRVTWPDDCKDANDVLVKHGRDRLRECVAKAEPWPIAGLYEAERYFDEVDDIYFNGHAAKVKTGLLSVDDLYSVAPGMLTVITGAPNAGKSTFVNHLLIYLARQYGHRTVICSFETPPQIHIPVLAEMLLQKRYLESDFGTRMTRDDLRAVYPFIREHFKFMQQEDGAKATIESIIERIVTAVFRWGVKCVVIDPYSYIERDKNDSETQFIDDILTRVRLIAQTYNLHIWFIAHTTKMQPREDGSYRVAGGFDIAGSAAWFSKADFGLTVYQEPQEPSLIKIVSWKVRFSWYGKKGDASVRWDQERQAYTCDVMTDMPPYLPELEAEF